MQQNPTLLRTPLSRRLCELFAWTKPNGELKDMSCRVALLRMQADGLITLAPSRMPRRGRPHFPATAATDAQAPLQRPVHDLESLSLQPVLGTPASRLWNEYIARYHYLGYTPMSGSQMRYNVFAGEQLVALLSFGASAWKLAGRDRFIGWQEPQRLKNLQLVVNNARFLILPWVQSKGLASKILSKVARQLPSDWQLRYGLSPGAVRDLRRVTAASRYLLQSSQLGARRADHRARQEIFRPPPDHPDQGHLAVSVAKGLRRGALPIAHWLSCCYGFTECLRPLSRNTTQVVDSHRLFLVIRTARGSFPACRPCVAGC